MPTNDDIEDRYRRILEEFGKFTGQTQDYRTRTEETLTDLRMLINTYWGATAKGMRQLGDWLYEMEQEAKKERTEYNIKRNRNERVIIALLVVAIAVGAVLIVRGS